jgi:hypothetical protein
MSHEESVYRATENMFNEAVEVRNWDLADRCLDDMFRISVLLNSEVLHSWVSKICCDYFEFRNSVKYEVN